MKTLRDSIIIGFLLLASYCLGMFMIDIGNISSNIERATNYILSTQEIVSGQDESIRELRHITDEFRAQIKGLQKEVLIGIQEGYNGQ